MSEVSDRVNSRHSERQSDIERELELECNEESERSAIKLRFPIYIETMTGTKFELQVFPCDTIKSIKCQLESAEGIAFSQQHLIWQNQELRNEFTVEDYGIRCGTHLRLVLALRAGPVSKSPIFFDSSTDVEENISNSESSQSIPLTVLVFQNGDQIKMFTIASNDSNAADEQTIFGSLTDLEKTLNNEGNDYKLKEDKKLKIKMREIQEKMKSIALRKTDSKKKKFNANADKAYSDGIERTRFLNLPLLEKTSDSMKINKNRKPTVNTTNGNIHLPAILNTPIISEDSFNSITSNKFSTNSKSIKSSRFQKQLNVIKRLLHSNDCTFRSLKRPNTSSTNKLNDLVGNQISTFKQYPEMWSELQSIDDKKKSSATIGSVISAEDKQRPRTTPFVGRISTNNIALLAKVSEIKPKNIIKQELSPQINYGEMGANNVKINSAQKLPLLKTNFNKKTNKTRCSFCRFKLGIINRFDCRCGLTFCAKHRYSEAHNCSFDYKEEGKRYLKQKNPIISAPKLPKI